jgi:hypothetical protein
MRPRMRTEIFRILQTALIAWMFSSFYANAEEQDFAGQTRRSDTPAQAGIKSRGTDISQLDASGSISGNVARDSDGTAIYGATVSIYDGSWNFIKNASTDATGFYTISNLDAGSYYLRAYSSGFQSEYYQDGTTEGAATAVAVVLGMTTPSINFNLALLGSISGNVARDSDGTGIYPVYVYLLNSAGSSIAATYTDSSGAYAFSWLTAGNYYLRTSNSLGFLDEYYDNVKTLNAATAVTVTLETDTPNINFGLALGGSISGRVVRDSDGSGISGITVSVYDSSWNNVKSTTTDTSGAFIILGLTASNYYLRAFSLGIPDEYYDNVTTQNAATAVAVALGTNTPNINFSLDTRGTISGRVARDSDGTGISGVTIWVYDGSWNSVRSLSTDSSGAYVILGLASGNYYIRTSNSLGYLDEYYSNALTQSAATAVAVTLGIDTPNINFGLTALGSISGKVTRDSDGSGISGVTIALLDIYGGSVKSTSTDSSGSYVLSGLESRNYYVRTSNSQGFQDEYYNNVISQSVATPVGVALATNTLNIDFSLALGGSISGKVTRDSDGSGISGVTVNLLDGGGSSVKSTSTSSSGAYTITGLPAGSYYVRTSNGLGFIDEYYSNVTTLNAATAIVVALGTNASNTNFSLALGGSISGKVSRDSDGTGISGVTVRVYDISWNNIKSTFTNSAGAYTISGLAAGSYYLQTSNSLGLLDEYYDNVTTQSAASAVAVTLGMNTPNINFGLNIIGSISGKVTRDSDGSGISGVYVYLLDSSGNSVKSTTTDSSGAYIIFSPSAGNYYLRTSNSLGFQDEYYNNVTILSAATAVLVTLGMNTSNINFGLNIIGSISGRVTRDSDGSGISGVSVCLSNSGVIYNRYTTTDSSGAYDFSGITAGNYYVWTSNSQGFVSVNSSPQTLRA